MTGAIFQKKLGVRGDYLLSPLLGVRGNISPPFGVLSKDRIKTNLVVWLVVVV
jgi:hypothetical protein